MRSFAFFLLVLLGGVLAPLSGDEPAAGPIDVEPQPFVAATERLLQALDFIGSPLPEADAGAVREAIKEPDAKKSVAAIQAVLDRHSLAMVRINPESRVSATEGPAKKELIQQGWRSFLVKIHNEARITPELKIESPNAAPLYARGKGARERPLTDDKLVSPGDVPNRFLDVDLYGKQPLKPALSGLECEYRIVQLYSRDFGRREATLSFHVGQGTQDLGFRSEIPILFECAPSVEVVLGVQDHDGQPTTAAFVIRDNQNRVYPNPARRLAPDFFFHDQIYRADGESVHLPSGDYTATVSRGPEYRVQAHKFTVPSGGVSHRQAFSLTRWIHPLTRGWYSGDHHVHAAGCAHYDSPTEGVGPADMMRHILGEDLNVGCVLSWGPCWYTQKQFFEGKTNALSKPDYLMRYDVEVSGFPSSHAGHLCLLRLKEDDYPGTTEIGQWPSWTEPVLRWGQDQGGVVGYSHSGWGLALPDYMPDGSRQFNKQPWGGAPAGWQGRAADKLPDYAMPPFDGIGANEYIVTAATGACDFLSAVDTPVIWELNIWYHTLNCGLRPRISGETDFPCIYGDKVGLGRIYVKMPTPHRRADVTPLGPSATSTVSTAAAKSPSTAADSGTFTFDAWCEGLKHGRSYCTDGLGHILDFQVNNVEVGTPGTDDKISQIDLQKPTKVKVGFDVAALLAEKPTPETERIRNARLDAKPYWHIERCRLGDSRKVPVEVIVNGEVAAREEVEADGTTRPMTFDIDIKESSWVAVRILPSVHTNPVFIEVGEKPIRANKRSAEWCRKAVDVCWEKKKNQIREPERAAAQAAYDSARRYYDGVVASFPN
jgi:hypothetical protein